MEDLTIGFATLADFQHIDLLLHEITNTIRSKGSVWSNYKVDSQIKKRKAIFKKLIKSDNKLFIAKIGSEVIGLLNLELILNVRHGWIRGHIEEVVVKEEYRAKGVGTRLIGTVKTYCKNNNIKSLKLMCGNQLKEAHKFYEKNGFVFTDRGYRVEC